MTLNLKQKVGEHKQIELFRARKYPFHFLYQLETYLDCRQCDLSELHLLVTKVRFPFRYRRRQPIYFPIQRIFFLFSQLLWEDGKFDFIEVNNHMFICSFVLNDKTTNLHTELGIQRRTVPFLPTAFLRMRGGLV